MQRTPATSGKSGRSSSAALRLLLIVLAAGAVGIAVFAVLARQATRVESIAPSEVEQRFQAVRDTLVGREEPLVRWNGGEGPTVVLPPSSTEGSGTGEPGRLGLLLYRPREERLVEIEVPFWFLRLKEPALRFMLREADFDWSRLGLGVDDLSRAGPGLVLDEIDAEGARVLIWLEPKQ